MNKNTEYEIDDFVKMLKEDINNNYYTQDEVYDNEDRVATLREVISLKDEKIRELEKEIGQLKTNQIGK